jgi:hypothetical protein
MDRRSANVANSNGDGGLYDEAEMAAEFGPADTATADVDDAVVGINDLDSDETEVTVAGKSFGKIRKAAFNPIVKELMIAKGIEMMKKMEISTLRNRMKCRIKREMTALAQGLFEDLRSTQSTGSQTKKDDSELQVPNYRNILETNYNISSTN